MGAGTRNARPAIRRLTDSQPVTTAVADEIYQYQVEAHDPDGVVLTYLLLDGPEGFNVDGDTGLVTWSTTGDSPAEAPVHLRVYDTRGGYATQEFTIDVAGGNQAPFVADLPDEFTITEGENFQIGLFAKLDGEMQEQMLLSTIEDMAEIETEFPRMVKAWREGDDKNLRKLMVESMADMPEFRAEILDKRAGVGLFGKIKRRFGNEGVGEATAG